MLLDVSKALAAEGVEMPFKTEVTLPDTESFGEPVVFPNPAILEGFYVSVGDNVHLYGTLRFQANAACVSCLEETTHEFSVPIEVTYALKPNDEDPDLYLYEGSKVDLSEMALEQATLALPMRWLCKPDCLGLCPRCGTNRNIASCSCRIEEQTINPFSALRLSEDEREV